MNVLLRTRTKLLINRLPIRVIRFIEKCTLSPGEACFLRSIIMSRRRYPENRDISYKRNQGLPKMVFVSCGNGGLTDRFKAMVSLYDFCKRNNIQFCIHSKTPYDFCDFFMPAEYDWSISDEEVSSALAGGTALKLFMDTRPGRGGNEWQDEQVALIKFVNSKCFSHILVYGSSPYGHPEFSKRFRELISLKQNLSEKLLELRAYLGNYASVSFRFVNLMGDSNEEVIGFTPLSNDQQNLLSEKCIRHLYDVKDMRGVNILVTTDSYKFGQTVKALGDSSIFCLEGERVHHHIGFSNTVSFKEIEKQIVEFFLISNSVEAFQIVVAPMYESKFPKWASSLNDIRYSIIHDKL